MKKIYHEISTNHQLYNASKVVAILWCDI